MLVTGVVFLFKETEAAERTDRAKSAGSQVAIQRAVADSTVAFHLFLLVLELTHETGDHEVTELWSY